MFCAVCSRLCTALSRFAMRLKCSWTSSAGCQAQIFFTALSGAHYVSSAVSLAQEGMCTGCCARPHPSSCQLPRSTAVCRIVRAGTSSLCEALRGCGASHVHHMDQHQFCGAVAASDQSYLSDSQLDVVQTLPARWPTSQPLFSVREQMTDIKRLLN